MIKIYELYIPLIDEIKKAFKEKIIKRVKFNQSPYCAYIVLHENIQLTRYSTGEIELKFDNDSFTIYPEDFDRIEII